MATQIPPLTRDWMDVGTALGFTAGQRYFIEALDGPVELRITDSAAAPADAARGRLIWPGTDRREPDGRIYLAAAGEHLHARAARGGARLAVDEES